MVHHLAMGQAAHRGWCHDVAGREIRQAAAARRDALAVARAIAAPRSKEHRMSVFSVDLKNQPGELARLCEAMADSGIKLILCATTRGEDGTVVFIADDEASAETVLQDSGIAYTMRPALTIRMETSPALARPRSANSPTLASTPTCSCRSASPTTCSSP
jgi:hypothetical protein